MPAPRPGAPFPAGPRPGAFAPAAARPTPVPGGGPAPRPAPGAPAAKRDPFGFGVAGPQKPAGASPAAAPRREEDFGDLDAERPRITAAAPITPPLDLSLDMDDATAPLPRAASKAIELPEEPETEPQLAPMHAFVPPADTTGHKPEPAAAAGDAGEAVLRDALSKASREVIERVVWEVVPELAETIIRENLDRLVKERQG